MPGTSHLNDLLARSRRRGVWNVALQQLGWVACAGLGAFVLLLLAGTQVLAWYWPVALVLAATLAALSRIRAKLPGTYEVAQSIDRRFSLQDLLSTAFHYCDGPPRSASPHSLAVTRDRAESASATISPAEAVPILFPRTALAALALLAVAGGLFFLRYGVLKTFALDAPLLQLRFDTLALLSSGASRQEPPRKPGQTPGAPQPDANGTPEKPPLPDDALQTLDLVEASPAPGSKSSDLKQQGLSLSKDGSENGDGQTRDDDPGSGEPNSSSPPSPENAGLPSPQNGKPPKESNSLIDKMRDALANVMDKLRPQQQDGDGKQSASSKQPSKNAQPSPDGMPSPGKPQASDAQGQQSEMPQQGAEDAQGNKSSQGDAAPNQNSNEPKTGMGKQEGRKDTQLAEQLEAMGKLSEILGKRSQSVQGEMTIEVQATKNQGLKTPYLDRKAAHAEAGGEIGRDEIPLHLQPYVQKYYEQIRKTAPPPAR